MDWIGFDLTRVMPFEISHHMTRSWARNSAIAYETRLFTSVIEVAQNGRARAEMKKFSLVSLADYATMSEVSG